MKKLLLLFFIGACLHQTAFSQSEWFYFPDEIYFVKEVPAKDLRGKEFKYQIAVRSMPTDTFSKVRINGVAAGRGMDDFLNNSKFAKEQSQDGEWTIYTITGTVPKEAFKLWFYSAVNGNGNFYFDNVQFYVKDGNEWMQMELSNASFEDAGKNIFKGYYVSNRTSAHLKTLVTRTVSFHGEQSLQVQTSGLMPTLPKSFTRQ